MARCARGTGTRGVHACTCTSRHHAAPRNARIGHARSSSTGPLTLWLPANSRTHAQVSRGPPRAQENSPCHPHNGPPHRCARRARRSRGTRAARRGSANLELRSSRWPRPHAKPARPSAASPHSTRAVHYPRRRAPVPDHPLFSPLRQLGARRHAAWLLQPIGMPARRVVAATERRRRNRPPSAST